MPLNCGAGEDSWEFLKCKEIKPVNLKGNQPWIFFGRTDAEADTPVFCSWYEQLPHWKSLWCWERLRVEGEEGIRGWDGWMASPMHGTWTWAKSRRWWGTGRAGMQQSMESQKVEHDWMTEQQQQQVTNIYCTTQGI